MPLPLSSTLMTTEGTESIMARAPSISLYREVSRDVQVDFALFLRHMRLNQINDALYHLAYRYSLYMSRAQARFKLKLAGIHYIAEQQNQLITTTARFLEEFLTLGRGKGFIVLCHQF